MLVSSEEHTDKVVFQPTTTEFRATFWKSLVEWVQLSGIFLWALVACCDDELLFTTAWSNLAALLLLDKMSLVLRRVVILQLITDIINFLRFSKHRMGNRGLHTTGSFWSLCPEFQGRCFTGVSVNPLHFILLLSLSVLIWVNLTMTCLSESRWFKIEFSKELEMKRVWDYLIYVNGPFSKILSTFFGIRPESQWKHQRNHVWRVLLQVLNLLPAGVVMLLMPRLCPHESMIISFRGDL